LTARDFVRMNRGIFEGLHKNMINGPEHKEITSSLKGISQ